MTSLSAVILAAGLSSRMGRFKPLLPLGGQSLLERCVNVFRTAGIEDIAVVTGHRSQESSEEARRLRVRTVYNAEYEQGMYSSVCAGVKTLPSTTDGFFILPVDIALVRQQSVQLLLESFCHDKADVTYPTFMEERGHPPILAARLVPDILAHDGTGGLRQLLETAASHVKDVPVADSAILADMDRPEDYDRATAGLDCRYPDLNECEALWSLFAVSEHVRAHCREVAAVAAELADALNATRKSDNQLDLALVFNAGLVHDLAKGNPGHASVGAERLLQWGFDAAADIVEVHPDLHHPHGQPLGEKEIVFLADKYVQGTQRVSLYQRYAGKLHKFADNPEAASAIQGRLARAQQVARNFALQSGLDPESLLLDTTLPRDNSTDSSP